jgi:hypothetical protein
MGKTAEKAKARAKAAKELCGGGGICAAGPARAFLVARTPAWVLRLGCRTMACEMSIELTFGGTGAPLL